MTLPHDNTIADFISLEVAPDAEGVSFGLIWAIGLDPGHYPEGFDASLDRLLLARKGDLTEEEDATRRAARDMLRYGRYKPTGRGKPACEYLVRAARESTFPRISPAVDICNYISLKYLLPASIWDIELAGRQYRARRGRADERYVFNASGQTIDLQDLLVVADAEDVPMVNPVKDCHRTKTNPSSTRVAAVVYLPAGASADHAAVVEDFRSLLAGCGDGTRTGTALAQSGA